MYSARQATQQDFEALEGPMRRTSRAMAIERDGELVAVTGYYLQEGRAVLFSAIKPEVREKSGFSRAMLRFARQLQGEVREMGFQLLAAADPTIPHSARFLERLGFKHEYKEIYSWRGQH